VGGGGGKRTSQWENEGVKWEGRGRKGLNLLHDGA